MPKTIKTHIIECRLSHIRANKLNRESAKIYNNILVNHWRIYRKKGIWISRHAAEKLEDYLTGPTILHSHSRDAAQQAFYKACATVKALRKGGRPEVKYPYKRKSYRTTIWKNTGLRIKEDTLLLSLARLNPAIEVKLPSNLKQYHQKQFKEVRLVKHKLTNQYQWHIVIDTLETRTTKKLGKNVIAIDLGEIHPAVATDMEQAVVFSARELRATNQYINKRLTQLNIIQSKMAKGSSRWCKLEKRKTKFLIKQYYRIHDIEHKVSRAVVDWAIERKAGKIVIGDKPIIIQGERLVYNRHLTKNLQQKFFQKSMSHFFHCIFYKANLVGIKVIRVDESYSSLICPKCGHEYKPQGRIYNCNACNFVGHREVVAASNILSKTLYGTFGKIYPIQTEYRHPFLIKKLSTHLDE